MEIVGIVHGHSEGLDVETIEVWYSKRLRKWHVERLDMNGDQIGLSHRCDDEDEASACLAEWLRAHAAARVATTPDKLTPAERRVLARGSVRRRAA